VTVVKAAGLASADPATSEAERARIEDLAGRLSMPVLARAWQMLLKGHDEVRNSPRPQAAADMVLVRLAYAADLPPPGELARQLKEGNASGNGAARSAPSTPERTPVRAEARDDVQAALQDEQDAAQHTPPPESENPAPPSALPAPQSFEDLVALADDKRDLKLKNALLEQVRLVRFKAGHIEVNPLPVAAPDLLQELMRKLKAWTGRVWIVSTSDQEGAEPLGATRRAQAEREMEQLRAHPAVQEVLQHFPDARIAAVRSTAHAAPGEDAGAEAAPEEDLKDDGTN
jgi:DNA polymerase-3 subunit gamma/tau